jgi:hypothetical protein
LAVGTTLIRSLAASGFIEALQTRRFGFMPGRKSLSEQLTETFTGRFTDQTMLFIVGGAVCLAAGLYMTARRE